MDVLQVRFEVIINDAANIQSFEIHVKLSIPLGPDKAI
jgi:hypothetical protein